MNFLDVIILSVVEGITEFLPISSTAHLQIVEKFSQHVSDFLKQLISASIVPFFDLTPRYHGMSLTIKCIF